MTREEFIKGFSEAENVPVSTAKPWISAMFEYLCNAIATNDKVNIPGLGTFYHKTHKGHTAYNFRTKETMQLPERYTLAFVATDTIKDRIANAHKED